MSLRAHTPISVRLDRAIDSGRVHNGETVHGRTTAAVFTATGTLPAGTPVEITVVSTAPAGQLTAAGEFSIELSRLGHQSVFTDIQTFRGQPGKREVADAAPALGTDAGLPAGAALTFHVMKPAVAADGPPKDLGRTPGSVTGIAVGSHPPAHKAAPNAGEPTYGTGPTAASSLATPSSTAAH